MCEQVRMPHLVGAATFAVIASALQLHVNEAVRKGWGLPQQLPQPASGALTFYTGSRPLYMRQISLALSMGARMSGLISQACVSVCSKRWDIL